MDNYITISAPRLIDKGNYDITDNPTVNISSINPITNIPTSTVTVSVGIDDSKTSKDLVDLFNVSIGSGLQATNLLYLSAPASGTQIQLEITSVDESGGITGLKIKDERGIGYNANTPLTVASVTTSTGTPITGSVSAPRSNKYVPVAKYIRNISISSIFEGFSGRNKCFKYFISEAIILSH